MPAADDSVGEIENNEKKDWIARAPHTHTPLCTAHRIDEHNGRTKNINLTSANPLSQMAERKQLLEGKQNIRNRSSKW